MTRLAKANFTKRESMVEQNKNPLTEPKVYKTPSVTVDAIVTKAKADGSG